MLTIVLIIVLSAVFFLFLLSIFTSVIAFYSPMLHKNTIDSSEGVKHKKAQKKDMAKKAHKIEKIEYEEAHTKSYDNLKLFGKFYKSDVENAPYIILMHGYRGIAERDYGYIFPMLYKKKYNILLIDERACGKSQGRAITFGIKERKDARTWVYYLLDKYGNDIDIYLYGVSMGAASVLMSTELNLPEQVKGIIADCPYSTPKDIIMKTCGSLYLPPSICFALLRFGAFIYCGVNIEGAAAKEAVKHNSIPILLMHGEKDFFVPAYMSKEIEDNCYGYVERHTFKEADHGYSSLVEPQRYERILLEFLNRK